MIEEMLSNIPTTCYLVLLKMNSKFLLQGGCASQFLILFSILCKAKLAVSALLFQYSERLC